MQAKLKKWGVSDYKSIFSRALGLNAIFSAVPDREVLTDEFVRHYYRYADQMFQIRQGRPPSPISAIWDSNSRSMLPANTRACWSASGPKPRALVRNWVGGPAALGMCYFGCLMTSWIT